MSEKETFNKLKPGLYITATPIGNLEDITLRAIDTLKNTDIIAAEDTRVSKKLLLHFNIKSKTIISYHEHSTEKDIENIINLIKKGNSIALISDSGSPLISDPGFKLVRKCYQENIYVTVIPGVSSVIASLQLSSLPTDKFLFGGFIPNKKLQKEKFFSEFKDMKATLIFFETSNRLIDSLKSAFKLFGNRKASVVREITKIYEECKLDNLENLIIYYQKNDSPKGEIVFLIEGVNKNSVLDVKKIEKEIKNLLKHNSLKDSAKIISEKYEIKRSKAYDIGIKIQKKSSN